MKSFSYQRVRSVEEGAAALAEGARALAGGTDLIPLMQDRVITPERLVDLSGLDADLRAIRRLPDGSTAIGALVTLAEAATDPALRSAYPALAEAAVGAGTPQIRNQGTVGGNLCQWNRCWYFRSGVPCHLRGGDDCPAAAGDHRFHAIFRDGPCIAVHASDLAVALLALGASVEVAGPRGPRQVPLAEFLRAPGAGRPDQVLLERGELVTGVRVPPPAGRSAFRKAMTRRVWDFALVSVAVVVDVQDGRVRRASIALGGVAAVPRRADGAAQSLVGQPLDEPSAARAAAAAVEGAQPLPRNAYKVDLTRRLVRVSLLELAAG